ncbi:hypothetical protein [Mycobacterium deserti]|uniref:Uncharacterized protein n=1 Tax=Mycobacterium deserti TaxID=2978347 RepID=A0ABT2MBW1_9MYCO|nr:hypothetical protein [Mycobacterium deserti]MCT7659759.1 hypothetical protein [Mycobacterium deserti]
MTALQDWLSSTIDPRSIKALIWDTIRGSADDQPSAVAEVAAPPLIRRGLERC